MSKKVGNISFYDSSGQADYGFTKPYSEKTAELIDQEVKEIIEESYQRSINILKDNLEGLTELAELLLEKEVIFSEDLERIFGKRKADILREQEEKNNGNRKSEEAKAGENRETITDGRIPGVKEVKTAVKRKKKDTSGEEETKIKPKEKDS